VVKWLRERGAGGRVCVHNRVGLTYDGSGGRS
jgi:hypothetical protein